MLKTKYEGELEIDHERGVIWFNDNTGQCRLRICRIPIKSLILREAQGEMIDINLESFKTTRRES